MDHHKFTDDSSHRIIRIQSQMPKQGESILSEHGSTTHLSQRDSMNISSILEEDFLCYRYGETTSRVNFVSDGNILPSSGTMHCRTRVQLDEGNLKDRVTGESAAFLQEEFLVLLNCDRPVPELMDSNNNGLMPTFEADTWVSESEFEEVLTDRDPYALILDWPELLEGDALVKEDIGSNYSKNEGLVSDYNVGSAETKENFFVVEPMASRTQDAQPRIEVSTLMDVSGASLTDTASTAQLPVMRIEGQNFIEEKKHMVDPLLRERQQPLARRLLLIDKELTDSDVRTNVTGIKLPKESVMEKFPLVPVAGLLLVTYGGVNEDTKWSMRLAVSHKKSQQSTTSREYMLKDTWRYVKHHSLERGDWLQIWEERHTQLDPRYIVTFSKSSKEYRPPSYQSYLIGKTWKLIVRKVLTQNDVKMGPRSSGTIGLEKKKVEEHFLHLQTKEGYEMPFCDWKEMDRTWLMALKFTPHKKGSVYRLDKTGEFCTFHHLQQDDCLEILKSEGPNARYALRALKSDEYRVRLAI